MNSQFRWNALTQDQVTVVDVSTRMEACSSWHLLDFGVQLIHRWFFTVVQATGGNNFSKFDACRIRAFLPSSCPSFSLNAVEHSWTKWWFPWDSSVSSAPCKTSHPVRGRDKLRVWTSTPLKYFPPKHHLILHCTHLGSSGVTSVRLRSTSEKSRIYRLEELVYRCFMSPNKY